MFDNKFFGRYVNIRFIETPVNCVQNTQIFGSRPYNYTYFTHMAELFTAQLQLILFPFVLLFCALLVYCFYKVMYLFINPPTTLQGAVVVALALSGIENEP
jgi:hypothetical protein